MIKQFFFKKSIVDKVKWFQVFLCITNNSIKTPDICLHTIQGSNSSIFLQFKFSMSQQS